MAGAWRVAGATSVAVITWVTRLAGLLALVSVLVPAGRRTLRGHVAAWLELPHEATVGAATVALVTGVLLMLLATGLKRRKRRAGSWRSPRPRCSPCRISGCGTPSARGSCRSRC